MLLAPAITDVGVPAIAAHFFVFYFGLASFLTPPVAIASYAAASLAKADLKETSIAGLKLGLSAFIIPFYFIYNPEILMVGEWNDIVISFILLAIAGVLLARSITLFSSVEGKTNLYGMIDLIISILTGTATIWLGKENMLIYAIIILGTGMIIFGNRFLKSNKI
jgi:TRAP-type uncharacterized transport system fused permease subunit